MCKKLTMEVLRDLKINFTQFLGGLSFTLKPPYSIGHDNL